MELYKMHYITSQLFIVLLSRNVWQNGNNVAKNQHEKIGNNLLCSHKKKTNKERHCSKRF